MIDIGQEMLIFMVVTIIIIFAAFIYVIEWRDKHKDF